MMQKNITAICRQRGFTLTELMVGMLLGIIVSMAVVAVYMLTMRASVDILSATKLNQELRSVMTLISGDLRRAGFLEGSASTVAGGGLDMVSDSCVLYVYDRNRSGVIDDDEVFGLREWTDANGNTSIQMRINETADCDSDAGWMILTGGAGDPIGLTLRFTQIWLDEDGNEQEGDFLCRNRTVAPELMGEDCTTVLAAADDWAASNPGISQEIQQIRQVRVNLDGDLGDHRIRMEETVRIRNDRNITVAASSP